MFFYNILPFHSDGPVLLAGDIFLYQDLTSYPIIGSMAASLFASAALIAHSSNEQPNILIGVLATRSRIASKNTPNSAEQAKRLDVFNNCPPPPWCLVENRHPFCTILYHNISWPTV